MTGHELDLERILLDPDSVTATPASDDERAAMGEWNAPLQFRPPLAQARFPVGALPDWLAEWVTAEAEATQTPLDLAGMLALGGLAIVAGGRVRVGVTPKWSEPANLFVAVALPSGGLKSAIFAHATAPLVAFESDELERLRPAIRDAEARQRIAADRAAKAEKDAARASTADRAEAEDKALSARAEADEVRVPPLPRLLVDDVTPEALASLLAEYGRIAIASPEGDTFDLMAGRYSQNKAPNLGVYLKAHAGDTLRVDRKGRQAEHVEQPSLTVLLAVQPDVLRTLATREGFRGRGLIARFLYALPTPTVGRRNVRDPRPMPSSVDESYHQNLYRLAAVLGARTEPLALRLAADAHELLVGFREGLEPRLGARGDLAHVTDWGGKLHGAVVRLAGLLHVAGARGAEPPEVISAATMAASIELGDYLLAHALAVFDLMAADADVERARRVFAWLQRTSAETFTRRDMFQSVRHRSVGERVGDFDAALGLLEEHGWIRPLPAPRGGAQGGRPPSPTWAVSPATKPAQPAEPGPPPGSAGSAGSVAIRSTDDADPEAAAEGVTWTA